MAHCEKIDSDVNIEYVVIFPFENDARVSGLSFEIERIRGGDDMQPKERFRTVGFNTIPEDVLQELESYSKESHEPSDLRDKLRAATLEAGPTTSPRDSNWME